MIIQRSRAITDLVSAIFILLFAYTAISKSFDLNNFIITLEGSPLIGKAASVLAYLVIAIESLIVALLFFPVTRGKGLFASSALMSVFTIYVGYMIFSGNQLPCSCGGIINGIGWQQHFILNLTLTVLAFLALILHIKTNKLKHHSTSLLQ